MMLSKAKKPGVALLAAVALTLAAGTPARAQDANRYAVVTITNASQDVTMNYSFKWGTGQW